MSTDAQRCSVLSVGEPSAFLAERRKGKSSFVIAVDHASARIPRRLGDLGLPPTELERHVAWDIGALAVARLISEALDAPLVAQNYSRLVIDCNRYPDTETSIPATAELHQVPGNVGISDAEIRARREEIFEPYHNALTALLEQRESDNRPTILFAQHTMTDVFKGVTREMHAAVLYGLDRRFAGFALDALRENKEFVIADNEPYTVVQGVHYTIPFHAESRGIPNLEIEIRQDLVSERAGQIAWAERICVALRAAERRFRTLE
jgi:predicted N-formylglutamate amidohydrolase